MARSKAWRRAAVFMIVFMSVAMGHCDPESPTASSNLWLNASGLPDAKLEEWYEAMRREYIAWCDKQDFGADGKKTLGNLRGTVLKVMG